MTALGKNIAAIAARDKLKKRQRDACDRPLDFLAELKGSTVATVSMSASKQAWQYEEGPCE